jgi:hypothetical protein
MGIAGAVTRRVARWMWFPAILRLRLGASRHEGLSVAASVSSVDVGVVEVCNFRINTGRAHPLPVCSVEATGKEDGCDDGNQETRRSSDCNTSCLGRGKWRRFSGFGLFRSLS